MNLFLLRIQIRNKKKKNLRNFVCVCGVGGDFFFTKNPNLKKYFFFFL